MTLLCFLICCDFVELEVRFSVCIIPVPHSSSVCSCGSGPVCCVASGFRGRCGVLVSRLGSGNFGCVCEGAGPVDTITSRAIREKEGSFTFSAAYSSPPLSYIPSWSSTSSFIVT